MNEFYRRAVRDPKIELRIFTALSLRKPTGASELERRFLEPFVARVFGNYPELDYVAAVRAGTLPAQYRGDRSSSWSPAPISMRRTRSSIT